MAQKTTEKPTHGKLPKSPHSHKESKSLNDEKSPDSRGRMIPEEIPEEEGCPPWKPNWKALSKIQSSINLDPTRFLIPVLTYGPNNQLSQGFQIDAK